MGQDAAASVARVLGALCLPGLMAAGCSGAQRSAPGEAATRQQHVMFSHEARDAVMEMNRDAVKEFEVYEGPLRNPERGFMQAIDIFKSDDILHVQSVGVSLGFAQVSLARFRNRPLTDAFLADVQKGLERVRRAGLKLVLRFEYDTHRGHDAPVQQVLQHIEQLTPILHDNADVIAVLQAGFIGAWGEWHSSANGLTTDKNKHAILQRLLSALPANRKLQVRSPVHKQAALQFDAAETDQSLSDERIGYHNDCLLADDTDQGTYPGAAEKWRRYLQEDRDDVPVGGETCKENPPSTHCGNAIYQLRQQRWSFLNRTYHPGVIGTWKAQGCLELIDRDLGYRFALKSIEVPSSLTAGASEDLYIELENLGYAVPYNPRPVIAVLSGPQGRFEMNLGWDPRAWEPDGIKRLATSMRIPEDAPPGPYSFSLWLPDPAPSLRHRPEYAVRLSNADVWDSKTGMNYLGQVQIE